MIASLEYKGHQFFGQWFERYDPKLHDAITGPVESFKTGDTALGYDEAETLGTFIRIGVGLLRKPVEPKLNDFKTYEILDSGKWTVRPGPDRVESAQELKGPAGYAYLYRKTVRLEKGKPRLLLEHALKNTGEKVIETDVYRLPDRPVPARTRYQNPDPEIQPPQFWSSSADFARCPSGCRS